MAAALTGAFCAQVGVVGKGEVQTRQSLHDQFVAQRLREKKDFLKRQLEALRKLNQRLTGGE
jgi:hypothetical protein